MSLVQETVVYNQPQVITYKYEKCSLSRFFNDNYITNVYDVYSNQLLFQIEEKWHLWDNHSKSLPYEITFHNYFDGYFAKYDDWFDKGSAYHDFSYDFSYYYPGVFPREVLLAQPDYGDLYHHFSQEYCYVPVVEYTEVWI